jgi:hypothetical protein
METLIGGGLFNAFKLNGKQLNLSLAAHSLFLDFESRLSKQIGQVC